MIDASRMSGNPRGFGFKLCKHSVSMQHKSIRVEIMVIIKQVDECRQLMGKQERTELITVGFLNINEGMLSVKMGDNEASRRRDAQRLSEVLRIFQIDEGLTFLMNGKYFYGS